MQTLVEQTGGSFARATEAGEVAQFFKQIDEAEPGSRDAVPAANVAVELYALPLGAVLLVWVAQGLMTLRRREPGSVVGSVIR